MTPTATILLLGSGELGREFVISAKRLGAHVIAVRQLRRGARDAGGRRLRSLFDARRRCAARGDRKAPPRPYRARGRGDPHRNPRRGRSRRLSRRPVGARGAADDEPRRDPRPRRERTRARDLDLRICGDARGTAGGRRAHRLPARRQARHVVVGQGPEHGEGGRRCRRGVGSCRRRDARRPAARHRRGVHRFRLRDHAADGPPQGRRQLLPADRSPAGARRLSRKLAARRNVRRRACRCAGYGRPRSSTPSAGTAFSGSNFS